MKTDIDQLMQQHNVEALLITGPAQHNPAMVYLTGGGHVTHADLIKQRGKPPVLFHGMMERDEATKTGLTTRDYDQYAWKDLFDAANGDLIELYAIRYQRMLTELGVTAGRVILYGVKEIGADFAIFTALQRRMPQITLTGFVGSDPIISQAMFTKDETEIARIRRMGKITTNVVGRVADYLCSQHIQSETLVDNIGQPITIGRVKDIINLWLAEQGAENPEGTIFALGRDAGVPHSTGTTNDILTLGKTIVFDIFPCEAQGGYFYDFTRTWCLGYAPDEVLAIYEMVHSTYQTLSSELAVNVPFSHYQKRTFDLFEFRGHPTSRSHPGTSSGYIHSLGHGVGLQVHEKPWSGATANESDCLAPGTVFTLEPGLYYPERGMGIRIEDTYYTRPDGSFEVLAPYPYDLILPVK